MSKKEENPEKHIKAENTFCQTLVHNVSTLHACVCIAVLLLASSLGGEEEEKSKESRKK